MYAKAGSQWDTGGEGKLVLSAEYGQEKLSLNGYSETLSATNPFDATISASDTRMNLGKIGLAWSKPFSSKVTVLVSGEVVRNFSFDTNLSATVAGFGKITPAQVGNRTWANYGVGMYYSITPQMGVSLYANGVTGDAIAGSGIQVGVGVRWNF